MSEPEIQTGSSSTVSTAHVNGSEVAHLPPATASRPATSPAPARPARPRRPWISWLVVLALVGGGAVAYRTYPPARRGMDSVKDFLLGASEDEDSQVGTNEDRAEPTSTRPGWVDLTPEEISELGIEVAEVRPQSDPIQLNINGTTAYDPNTELKIRPRFNSVIDKVYVDLGQEVKAGEPLVDLFSAELAAAKSQYEKAQARWEHDQRELQRAEKLFRESPPAISEKEYLSLKDDERVSRADAKVAADALMVYGVPKEELPRVSSEVGTDKAMMTLRASQGGVVVAKDVVQGNLYTETDILLVIATLDHLWVWGNVYPSDATQVSIGQKWVVRCPNAECEVNATIESISSQIDPTTKTVRIRTRIENPGGRLKADMLVGGYVEVPSPPSQTAIPRNAMISSDGNDFVFVEHREDDGQVRFERRPIRVNKEYHDTVIVADGLKPGERVAVRGGLILDQIEDDQRLR